MTTNTSHTNEHATKFVLENRVLALDIDREGKIIRRPIRKLRTGESRLENTVLSVLYPTIRVATVNIPKQMEMHEEVRVHETLADFCYQGVQYVLVGASGSAKEGKFYFAERESARRIAQRFHNWPEAAMVYFGMLISRCLAMVEEPDVKVLIVPDHALGTNDCRGWIKRSLFAKLNLPDGHLYQFRIAFDCAQGKGCFKVMEDTVAEALDADVILPESSIKPGLKMEKDDSQWLRQFKKIVPAALSIFNPLAKSGLTPPKRAGRPDRAMQESFSIFGSDRRFRGSVVLGVREVSRELEFNSSYQLTQFAPSDSIQLEILSESLAAINKLTDAVNDGRYDDLMELLGGSPETSMPIGLEQESDDDGELDIVRALLAADGSGVMIRYPYIRKRLNEVLAKWAFKVTTGGGYRLPAYMLADDGYLTLVNGTVYCGSDWIPKSSAITAGDSDRALIVRYPIRMFEDLLPVESISDVQLRKLLTERFRKQHCPISEQALANVIEGQLRLGGTLTLHSETASENGGDFDGDWCGLIYGGRFPRLVASRFDLTNPFKQTKTKHEKKKSNPLNTEAVALAAVGNQIGPITVLITRCIAAGRPDLAYKLVEQLQNALDSLKHQVKPDLDLVREIRKQVKSYAPWLAYKNVRKVSQLPDYLEVADTDKIGQLFNLLRPSIGEFFQGESKIKDFKGLILHSSPTREMLEECARVNRAYATVIGSISKRTEPIYKRLDTAKAELEAALKTAEENPRLENEQLVKQKRNAKSRAEDDVAMHEERTKEEMGAVIDWIKLWALGKTKSREAWCQALHRVVCQGEGNGSILVFAFPQELVDKVAERTGGKSVPVKQADVCDGFIYEEDGRSFLVEPVKTGPNQPGWRLTYLFTLKDGKYSAEDIADQELTAEEAARFDRVQTAEPVHGAEQTAEPKQVATLEDADVSFHPDELSQDEIFPPRSLENRDTGGEEEWFRQTQSANEAPEQVKPPAQD
jgi:hypothetical protein